MLDLLDVVSAAVVLLQTLKLLSLLCSISHQCWLNLDG